MFGLTGLKEKAFSVAGLGALLLVSAPHALAVSGNGGGYNGPSLASQSIPVAVDRGISLKNALQAVQVCLVTGDSKQGLVSVAQRIIMATNGAHLSSFTDFDVFPKAGISSENPGRLNFQASLSAVSRYYGNLTLNLDGDLAIDSAALDISWFPVRMSLKAPLPQVTFDSIAQESGYDDYGRVSEGAKILQGVHIVLPSDFGSDVALYNSETGKKTKLTINEEEYVQCLQSQIQGLAE